MFFKIIGLLIVKIRINSLFYLIRNINIYPLKLLDPYHYISNRYNKIVLPHWFPTKVLLETAQKEFFVYVYLKLQYHKLESWTCSIILLQRSKHQNLHQWKPNKWSMANNLLITLATINWFLPSSASYLTTDQSINDKMCFVLRLLL